MLKTIEKNTAIESVEVPPMSDHQKIVHDSNIDQKHIYNVAENQKITLIEHYKQNEQTNGIEKEINVSENAQLNHIIIAEMLDADTSILREYNVLKNGKVNVIIVALNEGNIFEQNIINLKEKGAVGDLNVLTIANAKTNAHYRMDINNLAPETKGNIMARGVVTGSGKNEFSGVGFIEKGADKAHNEQESRVLLLDGASRGDANPLLLINHYDVIAGHAASVGRVNADDLYYLMSRGIQKTTAEKMITIGFLKPIIRDIEDDNIRELVEEKIIKELYGEYNQN